MVKSKMKTIIRMKPTRLWALLALLLALTLACSLPGLSRRADSTGTPFSTALPQPTSTPSQPTATPQPLPPAVVETDPLQGEGLALDGKLTFYFNQPMDRSSVEAALSSSPALDGGYEWVDETTLAFAPSQPLQPESEVVITFGEGMRSAQGLSALSPASFTFQTVGHLRLEHVLPEDGAGEVNPSSAVVAAFNYPVVPLGADPAGLPAGFSLDPSSAGRGEWINTSTYIFYPEPALEGGKAYSVQVNPALQGVDGSPLAETAGWSFTTALPQLVGTAVEPPASYINLDAVIWLTFNQPMDTASVEANFALSGPDGAPVPGAFAWVENDSKFSFTPAELLERDTSYTWQLSGEAQARGGTPLGSSPSVGLTTVPDLAVTSTSPLNGGVKQNYEAVLITMSGPVGVEDLAPYVSITPALPNMSVWWNADERVINVYGDYMPSTEYTLTLSPDLPDPWGGTLGQAESLQFSTAPLPPTVRPTIFSDAIFLTPQDASVPVDATNVNRVTITQGSLTLNEFITMIGADDSYTIRQNFTPPDRKSWQQPLDVPPDTITEVPVYLTQSEQPLNPGLYHQRLEAPQGQKYDQVINLLVVSNIHLAFKLSPTEALVWAVDLRNNAPAEGLLLRILDKRGIEVASGQTDAEGVFHSPLSVVAEGYAPYFAVLGQPGEENFSLALSTWDIGIAPWNFGIPADYTGPRLEAYLYTDRPIYRPGQTVYFRAVVRDAYNGRYALPDLATLPLTVYKNYGEEIANLEVPISAYGTAHGEYALPPDAQPGDYRISSKMAEFGINVYFRVAEYRKPEINLQVEFGAEQALAGGTLAAVVNARYFFDAPADDIPVQWTLTENPAFIHLPGYQVGLENMGWLNARYYFPQGEAGLYVDSGEARTDPQGMLYLEFPAEAPEGSLRYTLEVTAVDESGFPVSGRDSVVVHPAEFQIGLRPETWVGRAGEESGFEVLVVDWEGDPAGSKSLRAEFNKVTWVREESNNPFISPTITPEYTLEASTDFTTDGEGLARLAFTPPEPGSYMLDVSGDGARSQVLLWVGGPGQVTWPNLENQRLRLAADRKEYQPGDTAHIFIPNPFPADALALVTTERSVILSQQVVSLPPGGSSLSLPLSSEEAPNIYVVVTLLGSEEDGTASYRQGYLNLPVAPVEQTLNVTLTSQPDRAGPGEEVTLDVQVTDSSGAPVEGEFSLSLVDLATLALADPNAPDIVPAFYDEQPIGVRTGLPMAVYPQTESQPPGGGGGGGDGGPPPVVRERFPDTAYWNAELVTDASGRAQVTVTLPDSLTTWQGSARGVTTDTRVGQSDTRLVTTKELLVRPAVPRFLVTGDHVQMAAVAQNNTAQEIQAQVSLQANGFILDDPALAAQTVTLPANGRLRVEWWGTVQDVESVDLIFEASGGGFQDAARPAAGDLPVLHYTAPQTFATSGIMDEGGERLELVSLPRSYDPQGGSLHVELTSSLAGSVMAALDVLEHYPYECTEQTLARFLPNLELHQALQATGSESPAVQARLERTLLEGVERLQAYQNQDGGWSWWQGGESDSFITSYVLFGLLRAQAAGVQVSQPAIDRGVSYLTASLVSPQALSERWQLDRLAFAHFVLAEAGMGNLGEAVALFNQRALLNPWSQAFLALTFNRLSPGSSEVTTLVSDLESAAIRSATGAHWEEAEAGYMNMSTPVSTTAMVVYALAQLDPQAPLVADATRYLSLNRQGDGAWGSTFSSAWAVMASAQVIASTGEQAGSYTFSSQINGSPLASGGAGGEGAPVTADVAVASLYPDYPNALLIQRDEGPGRLYYSAALNVRRPVEDVAPLDGGISLSRAYYPIEQSCGEGDECPALLEAAAGDVVEVRLTLTLKDAAYYLVVEDYLPAGSEILNSRLKTTQQYFPEEPQEPSYDPSDPYQDGWGWWLFNDPRVYDDHIAWAVDYLPAGTYQLTYYLSMLQPGEYQVLPARAWHFYFPEVKGNSAGEVFAIKPSN